MNTTATVRVIMSKRTRKQRQKFLATLSRSTGKPIRELKKHWGNGSALTIPGCTITETGKPWDGMNSKTWTFSGPDMEASFPVRNRDGLPGDSWKFGVLDIFGSQRNHGTIKDQTP